MRKCLLGALTTAAVAVMLAVSSLYFGLISFAADDPHSHAVTALITFAREQSISHAAADVVVPTDLDAPERRRRGAGNYHAMCVGCHLTPGIVDSEIRQGLYPSPANLSVQRERVSSTAADARDFWIIKHGIKGSGMPAWSKGGMEDQAIWDLVALLRALPTLSPDDYRKLVATSDGHSHNGASHGDSHAEHAHHDH